MGPPTTSSNGASRETSVLPGTVPVSSIPCAEDLQRRPSRPPDYEKENRARTAGERISRLADHHLSDAS